MWNRKLIGPIRTKNSKYCNCWFLYAVDSENIYSHHRPKYVELDSDIITTARLYSGDRLLLLPILVCSRNDSRIDLDKIYSNRSIWPDCAGRYCDFPAEESIFGGQFLIPLLFPRITNLNQPCNINFQKELSEERLQVMMGPVNRRTVNTVHP